RQQPAPSPCPSAGTSTHTIATSWRPFVAPPAGEAGLPPWVYRPLMEWTCQWAAGLDDEFAICNAIIANMGSSGLRYGIFGVYDGHCINFLVYDGGLYLYDACFGVGPFQVNAPLPANNTNVVQGGADLAPFKAAYLDAAIDYMLGSIRNGANLLQTIFPNVNG